VWVGRRSGVVWTARTYPAIETAVRVGSSHPHCIRVEPDRGVLGEASRVHRPSERRGVVVGVEDQQGDCDISTERRTQVKPAGVAIKHSERDAKVLGRSFVVDVSGRGQGHGRRGRVDPEEV
jgi:hypothetical protein